MNKLIAYKASLLHNHLYKNLLKIVKSNDKDLEIYSC